MGGGAVVSLLTQRLAAGPSVCEAQVSTMSTRPRTGWLRPCPWEQQVECTGGFSVSPPTAACLWARLAGRGGSEVGRGLAAQTNALLCMWLLLM